MLKQMRDKAQTFKPILWAVIFSFLISFVVIFQGGVGRGSFSSIGGRGNDAARVAGRAIGEKEFRSALVRQEDMLRQIFGANYDSSRYLNPRNVLDVLIDRAILLEEAERIGVEASREEIAGAIRDINAFHSQDGRFDKELYKEYLGRVGMRATDFERQVADDLTVAEMNRLLASGAAVPVAAVKDAWKRENETATAEFVTFPLQPHLASVTVTDDELKAYYDQHSSEYDAGPARQIRWVRFGSADFQKGLENEEEMRAYYQENLDAIFTMTEDQRRASVILVSVPAGASEDQKAAARARAESAAARAKAGEDFAALARELSDDAATREKGGDLGPFFQGSQDAVIDQAAFAAAEGDILGPLETSRGFEVVKVTKGAGSKARPYEEVRELVGRSLYAGRAAEAQADALKKFQDALGADPDFEKAAVAAGVKASEPTWITRGGTIPELGANPMIAARAFEVDVKSVSDPVADIGGQVIIQVLAEREASPQTFEEARAVVETAVKQDKARALARAEAEAYRSAAAAQGLLPTDGRTVETATDIRRGKEVPGGVGAAPDFVAVAFETPVGQVGRVADVPAGVAVLRVTQRTEFDEARFEADRDALAKRLEDQQATSLRTAALDRLRESYEDRIKINEKLLANYAPQQQQGG